ncbi:MAG TPA: RNA methyltransferase [Thermoanaerobaculales bacterium]|nr:RNA methyltransferase [Thermoanaerobaculales bacterium]HPA81333.1 RNA methyltransferase [Thermoanaerobaculales bacterium]HQP43258.1 RNA methyltransferase [Thermoanaerobaculales bacterium]
MQRLGRNSVRLKELRARVRERRPGEVVVDGRRVIGDLVRWGVPLLELYVADGTQPEPAIVAAALGAWQVETPLFEGLAPTRHPQGVLAVVPEPAGRAWPGRSGVALFLDGLQDPGNLGAIVRSAAALGASAVLLSEGCADPFHPAAVRGSAGAVFRVVLERGVAAERAIGRVRSRGGSAWAADAAGSPVSGWRPRRPTLLLLGAEGAGLSEAALADVDGQVAIPLERDVESLNVAVAAGILLHHLRSA